MTWVSPRVIRGNRGDLLSRWGILSTLAEFGLRKPDVFCTNPRHLPAELEARTLPYGKIYNLLPDLEGWQALLRGKVVVWTGGLDLQDDSSLVKLMHTLVLFGIYRLLGLRILIAMQGAGPLTTPLGRVLTRWILSLVDLFIVRDRGSHRLLTGIAPTAPLVLGHDGIFLDGFPGARLNAPEIAIIDRLAPSNPGRPLIGINLRLWFHFAQSWVPYQFAKSRYRARSEARMQEFVEAIATLVAELRRHHGARILLLSMYEPEVEPWEDDLPFLAAVKHHFLDDNDVVLVEDDLRIPAFFTLVARLDLMIGTRLHSTLTALRAGVPAIHLSYTMKGRDIFEDLGLGDYVIDLNRFISEPELAIRTASTILNQHEEATARVSAITADAIARNRIILADGLARLGGA